MPTRIAVPLDGSPLGDLALPYALAIARPASIAVTLLHVHRRQMPGEALEALPQFRFQSIVEFDDRADADSAELERARLATLAGELSRQHGVAIDSKLLFGPVAESLTDYFRTTDVDLVVMSTHGEGGAWHAWVGSVADAVVRQIDKPVLLVRPGTVSRMPWRDVDFGRVLVPLDGSMFAETLLPTVADLSRILGARVTLFSVASAEDARAGRWSTGVQELTEYLRSKAAEFPVDAPVPDVRVVPHRNTVLGILEEAEIGKYDLVAMATHGRGGLRHMLLGSTADKVMRGSSKPVLLLRPHTLRIPTEVAAGAATADA